MALGLWDWAQQLGLWPLTLAKEQKKTSSGGGGPRGKTVISLGMLEAVPLRGRKAKSKDLNNQQTLVKPLLCTMCSITCQ